MLNLRGHHLLCRISYQGKGYSPEFCLEMEKVVKAFQNPEQQIKILASPDLLCKACLHLSASGCASTSGLAGEAGVVDMDRRVLELLGAMAGEILTVGDINRRLKKIKSAKLDQICVRCSWYAEEICMPQIEDFLAE